MPSKSAPQDGSPSFLLAPAPLLQGEEELLALVPALQQQGARVFVLATGSALDRELAILGAELLGEGWSAPRPLPRLFGRWRRRRAFARLAVDLAHCRGERPFVALRELGVPRARARILSLHLPPAMKPPRGRELQQEFPELLLVASDYGRDCVRAWCPELEERIRVVAPGVDLVRFDPETVLGLRIQALGDRWRLPVDARVVLLVGPLRPGWGHAELVAAAAKLERDDFALVFMNAGEPEPETVERLQADAARGGLAARIHFVAVPEDRPAAYALADLVLWLAPQGPFEARPLLEAQAMGRPVVARRGGCGGEFLLPAATGWLVGGEDVEELAEVLRRALDFTPEVRARVAARGRGFIADRFPRERRIRRLLALYQEALAAVGAATGARDASRTASNASTRAAAPLSPAASASPRMRR